MNKDEAVRCLRATGSSLVDEYVAFVIGDDPNFFEDVIEVQEAVDEFNEYRRIHKDMGGDEVIDDRAKQNLQKLSHLDRRILSEKCRDWILNGIESVDVLILEGEWNEEILPAVFSILGRRAPLHDDDAHYYALVTAISNYIWRRTMRALENVEL